MKLNKTLYTVTNKEYLEELKKVGIENFLFPLKDYCVGYEEFYDINEITDNYVFINRILDNKSLDDLENVLKNNTDIKGIVFEDFGILEIINKLNLNVEKILYQSHFSTNYESINNNLEFVDSVIVSTDLTKEEIELILKNSKKELTIVLFGLVPAMYSRRKLITNFNEQFLLPEKQKITVSEKISKNDFILVENDYGTLGYYKKYYNGFSLINNNNIKYFLINPVFMNLEEQLLLINDIKNELLTTNLEYDNGFLEKSTIYKLKGDTNE